MLELTFDFPLGTFNLSFSKMNSPCSLKEKAREKKKKKRRKRKIKMNKVKLERKKREKNFCLSPMSEKSILCELSS